MSDLCTCDHAKSDHVRTIIRSGLGNPGSVPIGETYRCRLCLCQEFEPKAPTEKQPRAIGIIPAAGVGKRWGCYPKFLLPCGEREWLLDRTIRAMPCERVVVIYGDATRAEIVAHVARTGLSDKVILKPNEHMELDFFGSMLAGMEEEVDYYYFGMPDTYWPSETFGKMGNPGISLGVHSTDKPERFGMVRGGMVVNKQPGGPGLAWGLLGWDRQIRDLWRAAVLESYTQAINLAMQEFPVTTIPMDYYYDMASFADYAAFLRRIA